MSQPELMNGEREQELEARELRVYLRTVGDTVRLHILRLLSGHEEMSVSELVARLRLSQPLLSWHLGVLKRSQLVSIRREGRVIWYSLNQPVLQAFGDRFDAWMAGGAACTDQCEGE